jgi:colicin import membrane protein
MPSQADRIEFTPPPQRGLLRAVGLALLAHAVLLAGLTFGLHWKRDAQDAAVEAELWSATAMQAAPKAVETPPPPPEPPARAQVTPPPPVTRDADIALERARKQREAERQQRERLEKDKAAREKAARDKAARDKAEREKAERDKAERDRADDKRRQDAQRRKQEEAARAADEKARQDNIRRAQGLAGASGAPDATGNAMRSSGPSASYGQRLAAVFKRNISFPNPETISGNPKAVVEVRVGPSGYLLSSRLIKSSGVSAWDDAVMRAVEKTERIPADENGRYVSQFPVEFGPKD